MGKIENLEIRLFNADNQECYAFFPGDLIRGHVAFKVIKQVRVTSLVAVVKGYESIRWSDMAKSNVTYDTKYGYHQVLNLDYNLIPESTDFKVLEQGDYMYPFEIPLLDTLPFNIEGDGYHIRYHIEATIDRPSIFSRPHEEVYFTILPKFDLNSDPSLSLPLCLSDTKISGWYFDPIELKFQIFKSGFTKNESIKFRVEIGNQTGRDLDDLSVRLVQEVKLKSTTQNCSKRTYYFYSMAYENTIESFSWANWEGEYVICDDEVTGEVVYPHLNTKILQIRHYFEFKLKLGLFSKSKVLTLPITIGTEPITYSTLNQEEETIPYRTEESNSLVNYDELNNELNFVRTLQEAEDQPPPYESIYFTR